MDSKTEVNESDEDDQNFRKWLIFVQGCTCTTDLQFLKLPLSVRLKATDSSFPNNDPRREVLNENPLGYYSSSVWIAFQNIPLHGSHDCRRHTGPAVLKLRVENKNRSVAKFLSVRLTGQTARKKEIHFVEI